jgi:DNA-binding NarL/FixJ family response regulator
MQALKSTATRREEIKMRILLASNQMPMLSTLKRLMQYDSELRIVGEVIDADGLLPHAQESQADWILLDWGLPGLKATDLLPRLRSVCGIVAFGKEKARQEALVNRINAFVNDEDPPESWLDVLRAAGGLTPSFAE